MKKYYFAFVAVYFLSFANGQIINFPDANFKARLLVANTTNQIAKNLAGNYFKIDADSDGEIQQSEALEVSYIDFSYTFSYITSVNGVTNFINLKYLNCGNNPINSLDLNGLVNLRELLCFIIN